jgi:trans-aconitate methyltransferase
MLVYSLSSPYHNRFQMFPNAVILGLDSSPEMIEAASKFDGPGSNRASFKLGDMTELAKAPSESKFINT